MTDQIGSRSCGGCTLCCKILGVREIGKGRNKWCKFVSKDHHSCTVHELKPIRLITDEEYPRSCKEFRCLWLDNPERMPDWMRPDKMKAFLTGTIGGDGLVVHVDPGYPQAHMKNPLLGVLYHYHQAGIKLLAMVGERVYMMHAGIWQECEVTNHADGRIDVVLRGLDANGAGLTNATFKKRLPFDLSATNASVIK